MTRTPVPTLSRVYVGVVSWCPRCMQPAESFLISTLSRGAHGRPVYKFDCVHRDCGFAWNVQRGLAELHDRWMRRVGVRPTSELVSQTYVGGTQKTRSGARLSVHRK